jgi:hypothetical protein
MLKNIEAQRTYHDLFSLRKVVPGVSIQLHLAQLGDGDKFLRNDLGRVQKVETESKLVVFVHDLNTELWAISKVKVYQRWQHIPPTLGNGRLR